MSLLSRRSLLTFGGAAALGGVVYAAGGSSLFYAALTDATEASELDAPTAHQKAVSGEITLIDIRRPDEWASTGSGEGAQRLDMRREDFIDALDALVADRAAPIALICARGVRSARMSNRLMEAGFANIIDVPEGMLGSAAGPGWLKRGLPVVRS